MNPEVHIYRYVTEGTFDSYLWQTLENKQKFISQIMTSKSPVRSCEDVDETALSYAEIKALCAGDNRIKEKMSLDIDVARLKLMRANHQSEQFRLEDKILKTIPEQIEKDKGFIRGFEQDMQTVQEHSHLVGTSSISLASPQAAKPAHSDAPPLPTESDDSVGTPAGFAGMTVRGDTLTDKENAGAALLDACKEVKRAEPVLIGAYRGFDMYLKLEDFGSKYMLTLKGAMSHIVELGKDARGNLTRIDNALGGIESRKQAVQEHLENLYAQIETAKSELGRLFPYEEEYRVKSARLAELNAELSIDGKTPMERLAESETVLAKQARPSVLARLRAPPPAPEEKRKPHELEVCL